MKKYVFLKIVIVAITTVTLSACGGFFDKDNTPPPATLVNFTPEATPHSLWSTSIGSGVGKEALELKPVLKNNVIFTSNKSGSITATDRKTGSTLWKISTKKSLTTGPAIGENIVVVGDSDGTVIALNQANGKQLWTAPAASEMLATPAASQGIVVIKAINGRLEALAEKDGHAIWNYQQTEPVFILRRASSPQVSGDSVIAGFANGNLSKLTLDTGSLLWQQTIAMPQGSFSVQRMVDIDADPIIFNNIIYAAAYQGKIVALDLHSGREIWTHPISSYTGLTADYNKVYVSDAQGHVWAFDAKTGVINWRQTQLEARNITGPVTMGDYIVVGDAEGYLHWLSKQDGHFVARIKVNSSGILATPIVDNKTLYVVTKNGLLAAYTL